MMGRNKSFHGINLYADKGAKKWLVGRLVARKDNHHSDRTTLLWYPIEWLLMMESILNWWEDSLRRSLGIVLQDTHLFTEYDCGKHRMAVLLTGRNHLNSSGLQCKFLCQACWIRAMRQSWQMIGLASNGQRQLIAIARAATPMRLSWFWTKRRLRLTHGQKMVQEGMDFAWWKVGLSLLSPLPSIDDCPIPIMVMDHGRIIERGQQCFLDGRT